LCIYHDYDLAELGLPLAARPSEVGRGRHNYTLRGPAFIGFKNGSRVEVQLKERKFYIKACAFGRKSEGSPSIPWKLDPAEAWASTIERTGFDHLVEAPLL
jgi:hypothetical protein